eukprot:TRINITY_DN4587_c0_g1_i1.p1 TRINITY_DN4587_c0_g1~~TRINITY_DN4587_c0_g1_i1.p1  ORF type:complete len:187 (-),score=25.69 TRINITY_DN4587_c0_g1_i1:95-592(-)
MKFFVLVLVLNFSLNLNFVFSQTCVAGPGIGVEAASSGQPFMLGFNVAATSTGASQGVKTVSSDFPFHVKAGIKTTAGSGTIPLVWVGDLSDDGSQWVCRIVIDSSHTAWDAASSACSKVGAVAVVTCTLTGNLDLQCTHDSGNNLIFFLTTENILGEAVTQVDN